MRCEPGLGPPVNLPAHYAQHVKGAGITGPFLTSGIPNAQVLTGLIAGLTGISFTLGGVSSLPTRGMLISSTPFA